VFDGSRFSSEGLLPKQVDADTVVPGDSWNPPRCLDRIGALHTTQAYRIISAAHEQKRRVARTVGQAFKDGAANFTQVELLGGGQAKLEHQGAEHIAPGSDPDNVEVLFTDIAMPGMNVSTWRTWRASATRG
jgi:hypothetical protein